MGNGKLSCWEGKTDMFLQEEQRTPTTKITQWSLAPSLAQTLRKQRWALWWRALSFGFDFTFYLGKIVIKLILTNSNKPVSIVILPAAKFPSSTWFTDILSLYGHLKNLLKIKSSSTKVKAGLRLLCMVIDSRTHFTRRLMSILYWLYFQTV